MLAAVITNNFSRVLASFSGKKIDAVSPEKFQIDYFGERRKPVSKDPLQRDVYASLKAKLIETKGIDVDNQP